LRKQRNRLSIQAAAPYGYYWIYPAYGAYAADGHGGTRHGIPAKNLVIVYTVWDTPAESSSMILMRWLI
jgi:hypothetical protein